ncbi:MAG: sulfate adenylyltransferase subunit CysN [Bryobacteraceae bacterium]
MASTTSTLPETDLFESFLQAEKAKDLLRLSTAGSVDDGKSTLIGRLLYDSRGIYEDQLEAVTKASVGRNAGTIDFSLLTDGLRAEREQGITIDVAYRYFATPKRKFIIADTPGHEQYTRNMVTGASTAELAIVLVDARKGMLPQSRRHAYIASMLGLPQLVVAVNKMDLVGYDRAVFEEIVAEFKQFLGETKIQSYFVPISALAGDNVVSPSSNMPWFEGPNLLQYLEEVPAGSRTRRSSFRFPVQRVVRPDQHFRGYAGTIASGEIRPGDPVLVLPSGRRTTVEAITTFDGDLARAEASEAVTLSLKDEIDIIRGDVIVGVDEPPQQSHAIAATLVWLNATAAQLGARYRIKSATRQSTCTLNSIEYRININTLAHESARALEMNEIAVVHVDTARPLVFDPYDSNRTTGSFILIDPASNATVAAGLIRRSYDEGRSGRTAQFEWRLQQGSLVLSLRNSSAGFSVAPEEDSSANSGPIAIEDVEAADALQHLLRRLRISLPDRSTNEEGDYTI